MANDSQNTDAARKRSEKYSHLPEHVSLDDTVATKPAEPPPDPQMGRDSEQEYMLRNAGFF